MITNQDTLYYIRRALEMQENGNTTPDFTITAIEQLIRAYREQPTDRVTMHPAHVTLDAVMPPYMRGRCGMTANWGSDQVKCLKCGRVWDRSEERPDCDIYKGAEQ